jgi:GNAT superfamily N-acetyltransferase
VTGGGPLLATYEEHLRGRVPERLPEGMRTERDGPLVRIVGSLRGGFVDYRDLGGLEGAELDELIMRQVHVFAQRGESFEWKSHGHDRPSDLPDRLRAAGLLSDPEETVLVAPVVAIARAPALPPSVALREATADDDLVRVAAMEERIWHEETPWLAPMLAAWRALDPVAFRIVMAESGDRVISAAWMHVARGTPFARLHGAATLPEWRGRGVYRALVDQRARFAAQQGCRYLQVDASDASRPILERLGFTALATTTPFRWSPPG